MGASQTGQFFNGAPGEERHERENRLSAWFVSTYLSLFPNGSMNKISIDSICDPVQPHEMRDSSAEAAQRFSRGFVTGGAWVLYRL